MESAPIAPGESYPRQRARTRGFRLGVPRSFAIAPDAARIAFLRERSGSDPLGCLWVVDLDPSSAPQPVEDAVAGRLVADPRDDGLLGGGAEDLPPEERARRERLREVGGGITAFAVDRDVRVATFALGGRPYRVRLDAPGARPEPVPAPGPVVDPRPDPTGTRIAYVSAGALHVADASGWTTLVGPDGADADRLASTVTWGLADFIAAEELQRSRGYWWIADGTALLVARVDVAPVDEWWIGDPAEPARPPVAMRYPAAGRPNAEVTLWRIGLDGSRRLVAGGDEDLPYLAGVATPPGGRAVVSMLSRDQRTQVVLAVDEATGVSSELTRHVDEAWIDVVPGSPTLDGAGRLLEVRPDAATDAYRVHRDGDPISPPGFQVRAIVDDTGGPLLVQGSEDPVDDVPALLDDGGLRPLAGSGIAHARATADLLVMVASDPDGGPASIEVRGTADNTLLVRIASYAEQPVVRATPALLRLGERRLRTALLLPGGHVPGSQRLPVILSPYAGPHSRRVLAAPRLYGTEQWLADQGFAVAVIDGRGTPGRGPAWEHAVAGDLAGPVLDDQVDALAALLADHPDDLDGGRVGIRGWSFGGYLAALAVLDRPDVFHAAVAGAPVTEWRLYDTAYTERYLGDPTADAPAYDRCSLLTRAPALTRPLMLIHGLADDNVVAAHTLRLSAALLAAGKAHVVLPLSGVTHMTPQEVIAENLLLAERDFFRSHLGPAG